MWYLRRSIPRILSIVVFLPQIDMLIYHKCIQCSMVEEKPIIKHGTRILKPWEWIAIRDHLKSGTQIICDVSLHTEMRSTELWFFIQHPEWFTASRRAIDLPKEAILKKKCTLDERTILLSIEGVEAVKTMFGCSSRTRVEHDRSNLRKELKDAALAAKISDSGICPKMFRKTMISWLMATLPEKEPYILMSAGHGKDVQQRHYLAAGFERRDVEDMRKFLRGWGEA
jgi:hypothetical protein